MIFHRDCQTGEGGGEGEGGGANTVGSCVDNVVPTAVAPCVSHRRVAFRPATETLESLAFQGQIVDGTAHCVDSDRNGKRRVYRGAYLYSYTREELTTSSALHAATNDDKGPELMLYDHF